MAIATDGKLPPAQRRMLDVLLDGKPHPAWELHACLGFYGPRTNVKAHLTALRKFLRPAGKDIEYVLRAGQHYYRLFDRAGSMGTGDAMYLT